MNSDSDWCLQGGEGPTQLFHTQLEVQEMKVVNICIRDPETYIVIIFFLQLQFFLYAMYEE
jgi:hypothetical protein